MSEILTEVHSQQRRYPEKNELDDLARLQDLGIIKRVGGRKQGYWEIILK